MVALFAFFRLKIFFPNLNFYSIKCQFSIIKCQFFRYAYVQCVKVAEPLLLIFIQYLIANYILTSSFAEK